MVYTVWKQTLLTNAAMFVAAIFPILTDKTIIGSVPALLTSNATEVKMIMKSFITVYPNTEMYGGITYPGYYMIGYSGRSDLNIKQFDDAAMDKDIMADINEWDNIASRPSDLLKLKVKTAPQLSTYLNGVEQVSDNHPYTEFPLWRRITDPKYAQTLGSD